MSEKTKDIGDRYNDVKRRNARLATTQNGNEGPEDQEDWKSSRKFYELESTQKPSTPKDESKRHPNLNDDNRGQPDPGGNQKRPLSFSTPVSALGVASLNLESTPRLTDEDVSMQFISTAEDQLTSEGPRKRAALGDGISNGSVSPFRGSSNSPPPKNTKSRPSSAPYRGTSDADVYPFASDMVDNIPRPQPENKQLWREQDGPTLRNASTDPRNVASIQAHKQRTQALQSKSRKPIQSPQSNMSFRPPTATTTPTPAILRNPATSTGSQPLVESKDVKFELILQPETRPISQEQLVAEVKGIYAGLVMVEAKCIEVDNKQATLASADPSGQHKLNNDQWQALIALHRTLLYEHHDFFLASQHPSANAALKRLAAKYAMPARMWRHGIHSFLELLRHRLPASLDHMLAFIYLAYSMMALLYETVPAFEDTWIECLGDLGRYRMAIEDDDIRDREVWTGVARHWYSKASDKAPTTGRLYHHLAILARPNALMQIFYYSKSLAVVAPFPAARESILTLFEPILNSENSQSQYKLPPLDNSFVKAHGLLFTNKNMGKFDTAVDEFLTLLDNHVGRVTRKFMEQGTHISITNCVALLGYGAKDNVLMKILAPPAPPAPEAEGNTMEVDDSPAAIIFFQHAQRISNETLKIVLGRIGDPNVIPFVHITLLFLWNMSRHPGTMSMLESDFPWEMLVQMLNTFLASIDMTRIELDSFPLPEKDDNRPLPEDYALRGLLFAENYFPDGWFTNEKIDEEEKHHERASMTAQRTERSAWLARKITKEKDSCITFDGQMFAVAPRVLALARSVTDTSSIFSTTGRAETWSPKSEFEPDFDRTGKGYTPSSRASTLPAVATPSTG